jgi:hypothetical protein
VECNDDNNKNEPKCDAFQNQQETWRPTPVDENDIALNPSNHFLGHVGTENACMYKYESNALVVCLKEAIIYTMYIEVKEEYKDKIYSLSGYVTFISQETIPIKDITYSTNNGVYLITGKLTIPGNTYSNEGGGEVISCVAQVAIDLHTDTPTTNGVFNDMINRITVDYAYYSP